MSAYVVEKTTINNIVSWLSHEFLHSSHLRSIAERFGFDVESYGWEDRLVKAMYALNIEAVNQRYHEQNQIEEIVYSPYPWVSKISALKALSCWLYQCSEGNVPQTKLYQCLAEIEKQIALNIVMDLPEYEQANWG